MQHTQGTIAGSKIDWISQHTAIAEYFRSRFYETHNLFPQFAAELGGGQNIYNFAYYGMYDPMYLLSWLFPFIPMEIWFQIVGVISHLADGILCFIWLKHHTGERESAAGALMLMLSSAVVYHTSAQVMFVNYLPFFLLMLIGADVRKETGKSALLTAGTVCMILTSFYFAPACMAALGIWILTDTEKKGRTFREFVKTLFCRLSPVLFGILLSMFYLVPVFCALLAGRNGSGGSSLKELFVPDINAEKYLYSPYGLGLTAMAVIILSVWLCAGKCRERNISALLVVGFVLPVFPWLLNGGLYARSKVFLPFLPLVSFLGTRFFEQLTDWKERRISEIKLTGKRLAVSCMMSVLFLILGSRDLSKQGENILIFADFLLCGAGILVMVRKRRYPRQNSCRRSWNFVAVLTVCTMFTACVIEVLGTRNLRVTKQQMTELGDPAVKNAVESVLSEEKETVRMEVRGDSEYEKANQNRVLVSGQNLTTCYSSFENAAYTDFRESIGLARSTRNCLMQDAQNNPLFLRFMGVKYLIGGDGLPGWEKIRGSGQAAVYKNDKAAPLFYLTDQTMSAEMFDQMSWQEKQIALMEAAAVPDERGESVSMPAERTVNRKVTVQETRDENGSVTRRGENVHITAKKEITTTISLEQKSRKGEYVFLSFRVKNHRPGKDVSVTVNGVKNKLSSIYTEYYNGNEVFHYTFALPEGSKELTARFGAGDYEICETACCVGTVDETKNDALYQNPVELKLSVSGDGYEGQVQAKKNQWLVTSIPYDKNFAIYVDGTRVETSQVNGGFTGDEIPAGSHWVEMRYQAPGSRTGLALSGAAVISVAVWITGRRIGRKRKLREEVAYEDLSV